MSSFVDFSAGDNVDKPQISSRSAIQIQNNCAPFLAMHRTLRNIYDPITNPNGIVNLAVAENTLMHDELTRYYNSNLKMTSVDLTYGTGLTSSLRLSSATLAFLNRHFKPHPSMPLTPENLVISGGLTPLLSSLAFSLCDPGEGILTIAPYYSGFDLCFSVQNVKLVGVSVPFEHLFTQTELEHVENALRTSEVKIRAVIVCNPHNPLGRPYPADVLVGYARLCEKYNLHLISDEIYALSTFGSSLSTANATKFTSLLSLPLSTLRINKSRLHVLWGASKDFSSNGLRIGVLVTPSPDPSLLAALTISQFFTIPSSSSDALFSRLLSDEAFVENWIAKNQRALGDAYMWIRDWLEWHGIPYLPSESGHFIMVDLSRFLPSASSSSSSAPAPSREMALSRKFASAGVILTSGQSMKFPTEGWFRLTFATRRDFLVVGLRRLEGALGLDSCSWPGLNAVPDAISCISVTDPVNDDAEEHVHTDAWSVSHAHSTSPIQSLWLLMSLLKGMLLLLGWSY